MNDKEKLELNKNEIDEEITQKPTYQKVVKPSLIKRFIKRSFDIFSTGFVIILLLPFFILFTPIVAIAMKGNPFFVQKRIGKNNKVFSLIKYRTMTNAKDKNGNFLPDEDRLTKFGQIMRKFSIDELPELFNILFGQMSVVGPRPLLVEYLDYYTEEELKRHIVRPGLTGLAQINGRNFITWEEIFSYDLEYISKTSLIYDLNIIFQTIKKVLIGSDVEDATVIEIDDNDREYAIVNGEIKYIHQRLDEERKNDKRNR